MLPPFQCKHNNFRLRTRLCHLYSQESLPSSSGWPTGSTLGVLVAGELGILYAWGPQMSDDGRCRFTCFLGPGPTQQDFLETTAILPFTSTNITCDMYVYIYILYNTILYTASAQQRTLFFFLEQALGASQEDHRKSIYWRSSVKLACIILCRIILIQHFSGVNPKFGFSILAKHPSKDRQGQIRGYDATCCRGGAGFEEFP